MHDRFNFDFYRNCIYTLSILDLLLACFYCVISVLIWTWLNRSIHFNLNIFLELQPDTLIWCSLFISMILVAVGLMGVASMLRYKKYVLTMYSLGSLFLASIFLALAILPLYFTEAPSTLVLNLWDNIGHSGRQRAQDLFQCCGCLSLTDRATDSAACPISITTGFYNITKRPSCMDFVQMRILGPDNWIFGAIQLTMSFLQFFSAVIALITVHLPMPWPAPSQNPPDMLTTWPFSKSRSRSRPKPKSTAEPHLPQVEASTPGINTLCHSKSDSGTLGIRNSNSMWNARRTFDQLDPRLLTFIGLKMPLRLSTNSLGTGTKQVQEDSCGVDLEMADDDVSVASEPDIPVWWTSMNLMSV